MSIPLLSTDNLQKTYNGFAAVKGISFHVLEGEIFSLLGPNGAGKTTTISMLSCLLSPTGGDATVGGHSIQKESAAVRRLIGVVPQEIALYDSLTGRQNLAFWGSMYGLGGRELKQRSDELLDRVGLTDRAGDRVGNYSGGMKRRLNIAAGLLHRPRLLFMDEPTVGIDPQSRRRILDMVRELRTGGMTVLYTTHYMEEAEELSDRVGIIDQGRLIAVGNQDELTRMVGQDDTVRLSLGEMEAPAALVAAYRELPVVHQASALDHELILTVDEAAAALPELIALANRHGVPIRALEVEEPNLEAVFLHLTGRALRD